MSSNVFLFNATIRHQIFIQRFAGGQVALFEKGVIDARRQANALLRQKETSAMTRRQIASLVTDLNLATKEAFDLRNALFINNMEAFSTQEADFSLRMLEDAVETKIKPTTQRSLLTEVFKRPMEMGAAGKLTIKQALDAFSRKKSREIVRTVKDGILKGATNQQIRSGITDLSIGLQSRQASALVRTITNHTSTAAKTATYKRNSDVVAQEKYTAVLDGSTTEICGGLDGKLFDIGDGPHPPIHWNCRSVRTPVIKKEFDIIPQVETKRFARGEEGKSSVSGKTTYNSWLKTQPKGFQQEVLGVDKAKLFRDGGLSVDKFTDDKLKVLTLEDLKRTEPLAFSRAGLD